MSISSISGTNEGWAANSGNDPHGPTVSEMAAPLDANSAQTSAVLQLIQSAGQSEQSQVGPEPLVQSGGEGPGGSLSVYA